MEILSHFVKGLELYKKNFINFLTISLSRLGIGFGLIILALILALPTVLISEVIQLSAYNLAYVVFLITIFLLISPFLIYPVMAGIVLTLKKKKVNLKEVFLIIKNNYCKLLINFVIYLFVLWFLLFEGAILMLVSPFVSLFFLVSFIYFCIRFFFWDVLLFLGEKKSLQTSWKITEGKFTSSFIVILLMGFCLLLISSLSFQIGSFSDSLVWQFVWGSFDTLIWIIIPPFIVATKIIFTRHLMKEFNKA